MGKEGYTLVIANMENGIAQNLGKAMDNPIDIQKQVINISRKRITHNICN